MSEFAQSDGQGRELYSAEDIAESLAQIDQETRQDPGVQNRWLWQAALKNAAVSSERVSHGSQENMVFWLDTLKSDALNLQWLITRPDKQPAILGREEVNRIVGACILYAHTKQINIVAQDADVPPLNEDNGWDEDILETFTKLRGDLQAAGVELPELSEDGFYDFEEEN